MEEFEDFVEAPEGYSLRSNFNIFVFISSSFFYMKP